MVVQKLFRIAFALFLHAHRIASHRMRIRTARFAYFSHFRTFFTFLGVILQLMHQKVAKSAKKCVKYAKKSAKNCAMQMRCKNGIKIRIASHYCEENFSHFRIFSHRTTIPGSNILSNTYQILVENLIYT